ncbi:MAG: glycosyltransferase [Christensenella sp.]|uniref:glycosyltransferase n=1 Tax=Christensenella sp. TaxID=1935934 RepID=UPI002B20D66D|nr:glycosyltransferase [Christensenella sp.]MEA5001882.1 glycosyltransferase [Christensenella sp.]
MSEFSHSYAVCAYKESPYLKECLASLAAQKEASPFFIATSTPNVSMEGLAKEFGVPLYVSDKESGIGRDWNFALSHVETDFVTIAHQDDVYLPEYGKMLREYHRRAKDPILFFTDYGELRDGETVYETNLLRVKRKINSLIRPKAFWHSKFMRNRALSLGNAICCPSVCINRKRFPDFRFGEEMGSNLDWDAWSRLAKEKGSFVYIPQPLMLHRIHEGSETTNQLEDGKRFAEDFEMFRRYWPKPIAKVLMRKYASSADSNKISE